MLRVRLSSPTLARRRGDVKQVGPILNDKTGPCAGRALSQDGVCAGHSLEAVTVGYVEGRSGRVDLIRLGASAPVRAEHEGDQDVLSLVFLGREVEAISRAAAYDRRRSRGSRPTERPATSLAHTTLTRSPAAGPWLSGGR